MSPEQEIAVRFAVVFIVAMLLAMVPRKVTRFRRRLEDDERKRFDFARNLTPKKSGANYRRGPGRDFNHETRSTSKPHEKGRFGSTQREAWWV